MAEIQTFSILQKAWKVLAERARTYQGPTETEMEMLVASDWYKERGNTAEAERLREEAAKKNSLSTQGAAAEV